MTDLTHGIINLNGYDIGPETTLHEMFEAFPKAKRIGNGKEYLLLAQMGLESYVVGMHRTCGRINFPGLYRAENGKLISLQFPSF